MYGDDESRAATAAALASARVLRSEVGKQTGSSSRRRWSSSGRDPETARQLEDLLKQAAVADAAVHAQAVRATHAGDPDPYRKPVDDADGETDPDDDRSDDDGVGEPQA